MPESSLDPGFSYRLRQSVKALELARGTDISQEELGALVGKAMGRDPFTGVAAHRWLKGRRPGYTIMIALAKLLNVRPGWLAFGEDDTIAKKSSARAEAARAHLRRPGEHTLKARRPGRRPGDRAG